MFKKILIANRSEVATRVIRACKELGIKTVAIYSEADVNSLHVKKADEAYMIHGDPVKAYLNYYKIVDIARRAGVDAIHPGYGFLSERPDFAEYCRKKGVEFIGPSVEHLKMFGSKLKAKKVMKELGVPVAEGSDRAVSDIEEAKELAKKIGYPVMIKASHGGGGRGLRVARNEKELVSQFKTAVAEAEAAFGKGEVFIEKYIEEPRHIEIQIIADKNGNVVHLGERDCSMQRRHQKVLEIAPSPVLTKRQREKLGQICVRVAREIGYYGVGTWEFLMDKYGKFYFMEVNPRLQVEHTITEAVTGIDIVQEQIRIAAGMNLSFSQKSVNIYGFAMQFRINAEDVTRDFVPSPGTVTAYYSPGGIGVRIDGVVYKGYKIPPYYDSMIAKLIVWGRNWDEVIRRSRRALDEFVIRGVPTTIPFFKKILNDPEFIHGKFDTSFIDRKIKEFTFIKEPDPEILALALSAAIAAHHGL
ncbi:acetyl-CoA carboxylase biotin carboxylase subunit [Desulfurobacterium indicum]|uniref:Acetyl-CoA carboxylase biotin carboxylase subunit n=1 Tax=Desulfurobacterium indicum TaxID=1914305 RepID=A0A1R1MMT4_9BACT|nr:acetyl-CoA carboxylase biotin carboxylase subunit [Desulfurobacterium indicum]OMH41131.1 acetyl-CoA carboxylase biotin carboxylase subunit [Desulfurobacterium indicum]